MATLVRGARVLTFDARGTDHARADILVDGGTIAAIGPDLGAPPGARVIAAEGMLALPGLINAHLHSPGNLMRGMLDGMPLEIFMLWEVPPLAAGVPAAHLNRVRTLLGAAEMLKRGITTVMDDAFHIPVPTVDGIDAIMAAYRDIGMRARVAIDQPNIVEYEKYPFLADLLPAAARAEMDAAPRQSGEELAELYRHLIATWDGAAGGRLGAAVSCSAPQRVTVPYFRTLSELSRAHDLPFNIHILESKLQRVLGEEKFGRSLVRYVDDLGLLDERMLVIHAIWIDADDMARIARAGATVAHNPVCNLRLGSGIAPFRAWRDAGIPVCLGTDEACTDDTLNLWGAIKLAGLVHTLADPDWRRWPTAPEILGCAFGGGARALRWPVGALAPGLAADLVLLDLDTLAFTPLNDLHRQLVYCEQGESVRLVMVAGEVVVEDGRLLTLDEAALRAEARDLARRYRDEVAAASAAAARLEPYYRAMVLRAHARDVGLRRRLD